MTKKQISLRKDVLDALSDARQKLVPWGSIAGEESVLQSYTEESPQHYLNGYYLFPLKEFVVDSICKDIPGFINERFQVLLSSAAAANISIMLLISSKNGLNNIYLGFRTNQTSQYDPQLFASILNGILPGDAISLERTANVSSLVDGFKYGGIVTGMPAIAKDKDEKTRFNLTSIIRSLYNKNYVLAIISKPVSEEEKQKSFSELIQARDKIHSLVKITVGESKENGVSYSDSEQTSSEMSKSRGISITTSILSGNYTTTNLTNRTSGRTAGVSANQSQSLSLEQQNGWALELEKIATQYIERMIKGFNAGYWETTITFASDDKLACNIFGGTFIGELSKPSEQFLPPSRLYIGELDANRKLFFPKLDEKADATNAIFPKRLAAYVTSEELALFSSPPTESIPGYEVKKMPALGLTDFLANGGIKLGNIADYGNPVNGSFVSLSNRDLNKHLFVCGLTGSGKTTTVKNILKNLAANEKIPFLVLESAKRDYRQLLADDVFKNNLNIFTIGDATVSPIRFNPFYVQEGVHPLVHIDMLKAIFNASFSLYGPMPHIVEKCLHNIYIKKGWNLMTGVHPNFVDTKGNLDKDRYAHDEHYFCFPTLSDLKDEVDNYVKNEMEYQGELRDNIRTAIVTRLESLCIGAKGQMFNTFDFFKMDELLAKNTIFEMENLADDDDKAFFVGLMLVLISEYRQKDNPAINPGRTDKGLQHFLVIEEAHRLLKNVETERTSEMMGNPKGKAVEVFCNVISEMRSLGQGVAVVEQIPSKISPDVIKNSNTKIVHRLVSKDDQSLLAGSLSISDEDALYLNRLITGHALCHKEGMERPVECIVSDTVKSFAISDEKIYREMQSLTQNSLYDYRAYELDALLKDDGRELVIKFLNSLVTIKLENLPSLIDRASNELQEKILLSNVVFLCDKKVCLEYYTLMIMKLVNQGIYCRHNRIPDGLKNTLSNLLNKPSTDSHKKLLDHFEKLWSPRKVKEFINDIVESLALQFILQNDVSHDALDDVLASFFLVPDEQIIKAISQKILKRGVL